MQYFRYRLDLKYIGTDFNGWQSQADDSGIQDILEKSISTALGQKVKTVGASRTDSGVHARDQVAIFTTDAKVDTRRLLASLLALLPPSVGVTSINLTTPDFHPIAHAKAKSYCYRFWVGRTRDPMMEPFVHRVQDGIAVDAMQLASKAFIGTHDFTAYCAVDSGAKTRIRTILDVRVRQCGQTIELWVLGEGFLKQMVRIIAGTLLEVGLNKRSARSLMDTLGGAPRNAAGPTAPARGLTLERIYFDQIPVGPSWLST